jgi:ABC-2 type transport system ATP-binding protein
VTWALEIDGLAKHYGELVAVDGIELNVAEGVVFGLLGPNGAGKTTTISMIAGVVAPSRGTARVVGHDILRARDRARSALGVVPQELAIYDDLSAQENLRFFGALYGLRGALLDERIDWALAIARLRDRARDRVGGFSGGMKRRLNLVASLLHRPRVLILDEPTVGVDPQSRAHIFDSVRALRDEERMTIVYTSHYMEEVQALCDQVGVMDAGRIVAVDTVDGLIAAYASGSVDVRVAGDPRRLLGAVAAFGEAELRGDRLAVRCDASPGAIAAAIERAGGQVLELRARADNLESVFLALTGHGLRDD